MNKPLSYSAINTYSTCGYKYHLRYQKKLKPKYFHAALAFGSSIDKALNTLLETKDLAKAKVTFEKEWNFQWVNKKYVALAKYTEIVYAETDFDEELLHLEDIQKLEELVMAIDYSKSFMTLYKSILEAKKDKGWDNLSTTEKEYYNYCNWLSLMRKGYIMLDSYDKKVMPSIKTVLAVQKENYLENSEGDKVVQYLDLIVEWKDGQRILFDNKTSAREYEPNSASLSPQLISYYTGAKDEYNLTAVGFLVLKKTILKNRIKICSNCQYDGTGARHKTCSNEIAGKRCNGVWNETIDPQCDIQVIINKVSDTAENLVLSAFNEANAGIKKEAFYKNLGACKQGAIQCEFMRYCWNNDSSEIVNLSE
jgi:hypothetical protein